MLSAGSGPPRFSPSQNIRVIWSLPSYGNVHYRRRTLDSLSIEGGRRPLRQDRIPAVEDEPLHQKVCRSRPCAKSTHWMSQRQAGSCAIPS